MQQGRGAVLPEERGAVSHFYAAIQPRIKRRHMQLESASTLQIRCARVDAAAHRIRTSTGGQHGRFYNQARLLDFGT